MFEAFSAGSLDACSVVVPAAMSKVVLGEYVSAEFSRPLIRCLDAQLVVFARQLTELLRHEIQEALDLAAVADAS